MVPRRLDIAAKKLFAEAETDSKIEDQREIRPRLAARRYHGLAQLGPGGRFAGAALPTEARL